MGLLSSQFITVLEIWRVKVGSHARVFGLKYGKMAQKYQFSEICAQLFSAMDEKINPGMILVQDIGNILARTEPDFWFLTFLEFYGHKFFDFWPKILKMAKIWPKSGRKIPKRSKLQNPALYAPRYYLYIAPKSFPGLFLHRLLRNAAHKFLKIHIFGSFSHT